MFGKVKRLHPGSKALVPIAVMVNRHLMFEGKPRSARRYLAKAIQLSPASPGLYVRYMLNLMPSFYMRLLELRAAQLK
jgi:hypothetical protein